MMTRVSELTRRSALRLGAGAAGLFAWGTLLEPAGSRASPPLVPPTPADPAAAASAWPTRTAGSFVSAARGGVETNWIIARPPGQTAPLRTVIALHGMDSNAAEVMDLGVEESLAQLVGTGHQPIAVVSVDGGDTFWHPRASGQDSGAMVLNELLPMLPTMGLDTTRVGFMGWSMGGYGALMLGSRLGAARTAGICAVSPALYMTYWGAPPQAFDGIEDWRTNSVSNQPALASIPLRVDCGTFDRFYPATHRFVSQLATPPAGGFSLGGHDPGYWREQLPAQLAWLSS